jgi:phage terminase large subunit-like protein
VAFDVLRRDILHVASEVQIKRLAVDRWQSNQLSQELSGEGVEVVKMGQGYGSLSEPSKYLERLVSDHGLLHGGNPLVAWQASCCVVARDAAGNIKPAKDKSRGRIDCLFALVNAIGCWLEEKRDAELNWEISTI